MSNMRDFATRVRHHEITGQFLRYAVVGAVNVAIFFTLLNLLTPGDASKVRKVVAYVTAFLITSVISFFLNKRWAFKDDRRHRVAHQYALFVVLTAIGSTMQTTVFWLLLIPLHHYGRIGTNAAALPGIPLSVLWNFTAYRRWTFNAVTAAAGGPGSV